jgi:hypothetical protein
MKNQDGNPHAPFFLDERAPLSIVGRVPSRGVCGQYFPHQKPEIRQRLAIKLPQGKSC